MQSSEITLVILLSICCIIAIISMSQGSNLVKDGWLIPVFIAQIWSIVVYSKK